MQQRITTRQAFLILISVLTTSVLQPIFRDFLLWAGNGSWVPILIAIGLGVLILHAFITLARRFPEESFAEYAPKVWGPILGHALTLLLLAVFFLRSAIALRNVSEFFVTAILPETPISAVIFVMLFLVACALLAGLEGIVRFNELILPLMIGAFALILIGSLTQLKLWNLLPLFDKGSRGFLPVLQKTLSYLAAISFILFVYPCCTQRAQATIIGRRIVLIAGLLLLTVYLNTLLFLGSFMGASFTWPYLAVTENISIGIERGEVFFMVPWMLASFVKISFFVYICALGLSQMVPRVHIKWISLLLLPCITYVALRPSNLPTALIQHALLNQTALYAECGIPLLTLMLAIGRQKGDLSHEQKSD